jgi:flagellar biosynthesis protein FlhG
MDGGTLDPGRGERRPVSTTVERALTLPAAPRRRRTIAFTSGKGGVGKSSLVLNTGIVLARQGARVAVLDGDLGLANLHVLLGQSPRHDLRHVMAGDKRLADIAFTGPAGVRIIPAGPGVAELANMDDDDRTALLGQLDEVERSVDFLLIDTGAGLDDTVLDLVVASDEAVVVTRPEPTALADAYALMKVVILEIPSYPFHLLINMVRDATQGDQVFGSLTQILVKFLGYRPGYAGYVYEDPIVPQAVLRQTPFALLGPRAPATRCTEALAARLLGTSSRAADAPGFWERLARGRRSAG